MKRRTVSHPLGVAAAILALMLGLAACATLKESRPVFPLKEYEKMLVGPLDAEYIGNESCLKSCHDHDQIALILKESVHGQQTERGSAMPLVNCETCHGPGSQAVAHAAENKKCDTGKFIQLKELPAGARSLVCLKCHSAYSMSNMQYWPSSQHALADVSCSDCHKLHAGPRQKIEGAEINRVCAECHPEVTAQFSFFSRHPLNEGRMTCATCHEPHGSVNEQNLTAVDIKGLCARCHAEKTGPFVYEHADLMDDCGQCHQPHGSPFAGLLRYQEPFLCLECHTGHTEHGSEENPTPGYNRAIFTKCTNCHSMVHGTDTKGDTPTGGYIY